MMFLDQPAILVPLSAFAVDNDNGQCLIYVQNLYTNSGIRSDHIILGSMFL